MNESCEELRGQLVVLLQQAVELDRRISGIASRMGGMADRASDDERFDELYDELNAADEKREQVQLQVVEIESVMRNLNCG